MNTKDAPCTCTCMYIVDITQLTRHTYRCDFSIYAHVHMHVLVVCVCVCACIHVHMHMHRSLTIHMYSTMYTLQLYIHVHVPAGKPADCMYVGEPPMTRLEGPSVVGKTK